VVVTRAAHQSAELLAELAKVGLDGVPIPAIEIEQVPAGGPLDAAARHLHTYVWVVVTSPNGAQAMLGAAERVFTPLEAPWWAAVGPGTRRVLEKEGIEVRHVSEVPTAATLATTLPIKMGDAVLTIRGDQGDGSLADTLRARGAIVDDVVGYRTKLAPEASRALLFDALAIGPPDAVVFTSASTVAGLVSLADRSPQPRIVTVPAICFGRGAAVAARAAGFFVLLETDPAAPAAAAVQIANAIGVDRVLAQAT
jgi:uroporphyrinogen-III synthase